MFIDQCKGKMFDKIAKSKRPHNSAMFYCSVKLDGFYTQIHINHVTKEVHFYTSGNKEFHLIGLAKDFLIATEPLGMPIVVLEAEYCYACKGKLGDRVNSARLTTYRTEFAKGVERVGSHFDRFTIFNIIDEAQTFEERLKLMRNIEHQDNVKVAAQRLLSYEDAHIWTRNMVALGWEGAMLNDPDEYYLPGKRLNNIVKIKYRPEMVVLCIDELEGDGRLQGAIGALQCQIAETGVVFKVGSGLDDYMRSLWGAFVGQLVEVDYEQLSGDGIPLQPTFKRRAGED